LDKCLLIGGDNMTKDGIQHSSLEQIRKDHETETAFKVDNPKQQETRTKKNK
jgi:hypothetical protein